MKFTDGFWHTRPGVEALYAQDVRDLVVDGDELVAWASTRVVERRGDTLNRPMLTVSLGSPAEGVIRVRVEHHEGGRRDPGFAVRSDAAYRPELSVDDEGGVVHAGSLRARVRRGAPWELTFERAAGSTTRSARRSRPRWPRRGGSRPFGPAAG
ncbi:hypothetical protein [Agromyces humi]|uniref:hypothetical protein n=1 Tax=Agromyces humi TaxID=1766800 RepID=UPI001356EB03|nr:hypothetical protein [Agromyces humi]